MTDDLIDRLSTTARPISRQAVAQRLAIGIGLGGLSSIGLTAATLGFRPDMPTAVGEAMFWSKLAYTLALGGVALWACERLARPGVSAARRIAWLLPPFLMIAGLAAWQLVEAPAAERMPMIMGGSADVCPWCILTISLPPLFGLIWAVRGLAPTRLGLTGGMIGLAAGGAGASVYALHCTESTAPFLAIWYTLGVAAAGGIGLLVGPRLLRW